MANAYAANIPLPGAGGPYGAAGGIMPASFSAVVGRGMWGGQNPLTPDNYANLESWLSYNNMGGMGMSYQEYVQQWNAMRTAGTTTPTTQSGVTPIGGGDGGYGGGGQQQAAGAGQIGRGHGGTQ